MKKCEEWLEKHHPDMHEKLYSDGIVNFSAAASSSRIELLISGCSRCIECQSVRTLR